MRITLLSTLPDDHDRTLRWVRDGLDALGHDITCTDRPGLGPQLAADLGYRVADTWRPARPDVVLALGWVAGVATQVATREHRLPVLLRLPRPGRSGDPAVTRVERALARSGAVVLARSTSEAEVLVRLGAPRARVRVLPEAVDVASGGVASAVGPGDVTVATDDDASGVATVLDAMAAGRPTVVLDRGILGDLVADQVTGLVVPPHGDLPAAVHTLRSDPIRREAMGMAACDRAQACFATGVVVTTLGRLVDEALLVTRAA